MLTSLSPHDWRWQVCFRKEVDLVHTIPNMLIQFWDFFWLICQSWLWRSRKDKRNCYCADIWSGSMLSFLAAWLSRLECI